MKIGILGFGSQGRSAYWYWNKPENDITICDQDPNTTIPDNVKHNLGKEYLKRLDQFDLLIRTPLLHPFDIKNANPDSPDILDKVTTVTNEFLRVCPTKNIIGVTGTKGKGTTSTLITKFLEHAGFRVHLGGNIGIPPLEMLKNDIQADDWVVLELANFQLIDIQYSPPIAVCLMVEPEHLNWHADMEEYITAKQQLFKWQNTSDRAIYFGNNINSKKVASVSSGQLIPYFKEPGATISDDRITIAAKTICTIEDIKLLGRHNLQNVCAAITAVWSITQDIEAINFVLTTFTGLEHRLELVRTINDVRYYDDSFGTTPDTAIVAIESFNNPLVIILGGSDKGSDFSKLAKMIQLSNVKKVVLIGDTAPKIQAALDKIGYQDYVSGGNTMHDIVTQTRTLASPGDTVLLSTGCASFGLFANYKDRGDQFKHEVQALV